ncbi:LytR C-terminal domain-containing protein [Streptomyces sp. enrichment culture]|uniref:LytR C-terminal domain-containing protein n=1 Tax=Streptomyces sp. enrichment culture TaxID=1795815 RepID=UPI003F56478B
MGGQYRITGDKYPRMRRPRRHGRLVVLVVASVAVLGGAGWGTLQLIDVFTGGDESASATGAGAACTTEASPAAAPKALPEPGTITVNVLNATTRGGLAQKTADELKKRGFRIGEVANATEEYDKKVKGTGVLLGPATALDTSLPVLGAQLPGAEHRTDAARKGNEVDLIIGDGFRSLTKKADADRALAALAAPEPTPATKKNC